MDHRIEVCKCHDAVALGSVDLTRDDHCHRLHRQRWEEKNPGGMKGGGNGEPTRGDVRARGHHEAEPKRRPEVAGHVA